MFSLDSRLPVHDRADMFAFIWLLVSSDNYFTDGISVNYGNIVHS